jgi:hypothetical protein
MKSFRSFLIGMVITVGLAASLHFLNAQETATPSQPAQADSIVQITADAQGLTLLSPDQVPNNGTFWMVSPGSGGVIAPPMPCPPLDTNLPIYAIAGGQFLVDGTVSDQAASSTGEAALEAQANAVVNLISQVQTAAANLQLQAMGMGVPYPGAGSGDGTNGLFYSDSSTPLIFNTNGLWLEINGITNHQVYITAHNVTTNFFQLLFKTNLLETDWTAEQLFQPNGPSSALALAPVPELYPGATNSQMFFWAMQSYSIVGVGVNASTDVAIRPSPGFAPVPSYFYIQSSTADGSYDSDLVVQFSLSGTATNGVDYVLRNYYTQEILTDNSITILTNNYYATIELDPLTNLLCVSNLTVTLTLEDDTNYLVDNNNCDYIGWPAATNTIIPNVFSVVVNVPNTAGIDYHPPTQSLIVSSKSNGVWSFLHIDANGDVTPWSGILITNGGNEVELATVKNTANGFTNGAMYFDSSSSGTIGLLSPDGSVSNVNFATVSGSRFSGLYIDQGGSFGGNLIAGQESGGVWLIKSNGVASNIVAANQIESDPQGIISLTNNFGLYGPWAGKIVTGQQFDANNPQLYSIDTNGVVSANYPSLNMYVEDCDLIVTNQNLYCEDDTDGSILKVPKELFAGHEGDVLITQAGDVTPPGLFIVHWDATNGFVVTQIPMPGNDIISFEQSTFAPIDIPPLSQ